MSIVLKKSLLVKKFLSFFPLSTDPEIKSIIDRSFNLKGCFGSPYPPTFAKVQLQLFLFKMAQWEWKEYMGFGDKNYRTETMTLIQIED